MSPVGDTFSAICIAIFTQHSALQENIPSLSLRGLFYLSKAKVFSLPLRLGYLAAYD
jgi:hypothetical protein